MKTAIACLSWHLFVDCPECSKTIDLVDQDDGNDYAAAIFQNKWDDMRGAEIECPECGAVFEIEKIEY